MQEGQWATRVLWPYRSKGGIRHYLACEENPSSRHRKRLSGTIGELEATQHALVPGFDEMNYDFNIIF